MEEEVQQAEETASPASGENNQPEEVTSVSEDVKTQETETGEKTVPYSRFKEVNDQKKAYEELLRAKSGQEISHSEETHQVENDEYKDAVKLVEGIVRRELTVSERRLKSEMDLQKVMSQNPDFVQHSAKIGEIIKDNPTMSWDNAYKLAKFDAIASESINRGKQEAYKKIEQKTKATVETGGAKPKGGLTGDIDPMAKGPDGKFLYSTKELESILPR